MLTEPTLDEESRLRALREAGLLDTPREAAFDEIADFAARICEAPVALVSLLDRDRQWFKSTIGVEDLSETPRSMSICAHAVASGSYLEIPDTRDDARTATNPAVTGPPQFRFYAGALLRTRDGAALGTLCVLDHKPRRLTVLQRETLEFLAGQVMHQIELRQALEVEETLRAEIDHRVKNSLQTVASVLRLQRSQVGDPAAEQALRAAERRIATVALVHSALYQTEAAEALDLAEFLPRVTGLLARTLPSGIRILPDVDPVTIGAAEARALAMIVSEFVANSAKHAFAEGEAGAIHLTGRSGAGGYTLTLADTGKGLDHAAPAASGGGIGLKIIAASALQIGSEPEWGAGPDGTGTALTLRVPVAGG